MKAITRFASQPKRHKTQRKWLFFAIFIVWNATIIHICVTVEIFRCSSKRINDPSRNCWFRWTISFVVWNWNQLDEISTFLAIGQYTLNDDAKTPEFVWFFVSFFCCRLLLTHPTRWFSAWRRVESSHVFKDVHRKLTNECQFWHVQCDNFIGRPSVSQSELVFSFVRVYVC